MHTTHTTQDSTVDHGLGTECRCPDDRCAGYHHPVGGTCFCTIAREKEIDNQASFFTIVDGGEQDLGTFVDRDDSPQLRIVYKSVLAEDGVTLTVFRDSAVTALDRTIDAVPLPSAAELRVIVRTVAESIIDGTLGKDRAHLFTVDLKNFLEDIGDAMIHPTWCKDDDMCWAHYTKANAEHASDTETVEGAEFTAEAVLEVIVGTVDHRDEPDPSIMPRIEITEAGSEPIWLTLYPADLRTLGKFILEQADRFEGMIHEVEVQS